MDIVLTIRFSKQTWTSVLVGLHVAILLLIQYWSMLLTSTYLMLSESFIDQAWVSLPHGPYYKNHNQLQFHFSQKNLKIALHV